jgi:Skp family chaperone for outer membrane proteins
VRKITLKLIAALIVSMVAFPAFGQQDGAGGIVAVLDVAMVFKNNADFDQKLKSIKAEAEAFKGKIQGKQEGIRQRAQSVMALEVGTPERNQQEAKIEQEQAALRTEARQIEGELLKREAKIYYDAYVEMQQVVTRIATQNGITLVLRFDSAPINPNNRPEVIKGVNRAVVYHRQLDLTKLVIKELGTASARLPTNSK